MINEAYRDGPVLVGAARAERDRSARRDGDAADARRCAARLGRDHSRGDGRATQQTHAPIVRPVRGDDHGHPVLIDRSLFRACARPIRRSASNRLFAAHVSPAGDVVVDDAGAFLDIDTPDDYQRVLNGIDAS